MPAGEHNGFIIERGATFNPVITYKDAAGAAIPNTGGSAVMKIRNKEGDTVIATFNSGTEITLGGADGKLTFNVIPAATALLEVGTYCYDLDLTFASGVVDRIIEGAIEIRGSISE